MKTMEKIGKLPFASHFVDLNGAKMHYFDEGKGDPILFLHSVPSSSFAWRKIIPHLTNLGRCIAPDLMGMGQSDKPNMQYTIAEHIDLITQFIDALKLKKITFVLHGWGSIIGFTYAMKHESNCKGLVFYESYLRPYQDDDVSLPFQEQLSLLQKQTDLDSLIADGPYFVDKVLPQEMLQAISEDEMRFYRQPFLTKGSGKALCQYWKELPRGDGNSHVDKMIQEYSLKLIKSSLPKLMLYSVPGFITTVATLIWAKKNLKKLEMAEVGEDLHFAQESNPLIVGETISIWLQGIEQQEGNK